MSKFSEEIANLSPEQRALLELRIKKKRESALEAQTTPQKNDLTASSSMKSDEENLVLAESIHKVDGLIAKFYGRFPWPWKPLKFDYLDDPDFATIMLNQDIGDWEHRTIPECPKIWVAGCGTNQAIETALKFPKATVLGTDISTESLEVCTQNAKELGTSNLELKEESINDVTYKERFDYIISTGVIHHNANPEATLKKLFLALKPTGILELMVYNRYRRMTTSAFQKAMRIFGKSRSTVNFESDLSLAKKIINNFPIENMMSHTFNQCMDWSEADLADHLIQPVEHSYTVESLEDMAETCDMQLVAPCISLYAKSLGLTLSWNMEFNDPELQEDYDSLPDSSRWQITNLLLFEESPLIWFYLQRKNCDRQRKSENQICEEFLNTRFIRNNATQRSYIREEDGKYRLSPKTVPYPFAFPDSSVRQIFESVDATSSMKEIFQRLKLRTTFQTVNQARLQLTTSAFPYLRAV